MRAFVENEMLPVIGGYWERAEFPWELARRMGELELVGDGIEGYGCPEMSMPSAGIIAMELSRGDGSLATFGGVQAGLAMRSIAMQIILEARDLLRGNGILLENHVIRHLADIEALHTYEGTETIQTLLVGREITGVGAFV
jgi:alkylation response protein AidB-like acyl-CoA dehydrogenase